LKQRIQEIGDRREEYRLALEKYGDEDNFPNKVAKSLFRPFKTDDGKSTKRSPYTKEAHRRGFEGGLKKKAIAASEYYKGNIPLSVLKTVFNRGKAAWSSGGHRANQTPESWGYARVNSFLVGGKTYWTTDSDQRRLLSPAVQQAIALDAVYNPTLGVIFVR